MVFLIKQQVSDGDFTHLAKQAIQMELVRMGDKSQLYVVGSWRPTVTVNFCNNQRQKTLSE